MIEYIKMLQPHQQRVVEEKKELDEKLDRLYAFVNAENQTAIFKMLPVRERNRLHRQCAIMEEYSNILGSRIADF